MPRLRPLLPLSLLAFTILSIDGLQSAKDAAAFTEHLLVRPLLDGKVFTKFTFDLTSIVAAQPEGPDGNRAIHTTIFPLSLASLLSSLPQTKEGNSPRVEELHLTLSRGRWDYSRWGYPGNGRGDNIDGLASGVEISAWISGEDDDESDSRSAIGSPTWTYLTNSFAGIICASLNQLDGTKTARPDLTYAPVSSNSSQPGSSKLYHALLPTEHPCTENLSPFLRLLPCPSSSSSPSATGAGLAQLINPRSLFDNDYAGLGIHFTRQSGVNEEGGDELWKLRLEVQGVRDPVRLDRVKGGNGRRDWSFSSLLDRTVTRSCPVASSSVIEIQPPAVTSSQDTDLRDRYRIEPEGTRPEGDGVAAFDLLKGDLTWPLDVSMKWEGGDFEYPPTYETAPIYARRLLTGYGQEKGSIGVEVFNSLDLPVEVKYLEVLPWWMPIYLGTKKVNSGGIPRDDLFNLTRYIPATSRTRPTHLEATLTVLPNSSLVLLFEFEKLILRYTEYPPDANRGFDVPPAVFVLPPLPELGSTTDVRERRVYTTSTLMSLATPDFSMPYNVIILTGTVIALIFSSIVNLLVRRFVVVRLKPRRKEETETERTKLE